MKYSTHKYAALLLLPLLLGACGTVRETLGIEAQGGPDEFDVATAPPLSIPPEFNLRPPEPGAPRPQAVNPQTTARELLTGAAPAEGEIVDVPTSAPAGSVEDALLSNIGTATQPAAKFDSGDNTTATPLDETARVQMILESPVTRNEPGKLPTIELDDKTGAFWDSWF